MSQTATNDDDVSVVGRPIRVLHVDDEPGLADLAAEFLQRANDRIDVVTETHPTDALERLGETELDCVVTDYDMPDMDGIDLIRTVRTEYGDLPCIIYTGQGSEEVASDAIAAGATDYLQKQRGNEQYELLANRIENAVESYRAERRATTLERIRNVVREVNQTLVRTSSRGEVERRVCDILADAETYRAAWIGTEVDESREITRRASAGIDDEYFESFTITVADEPAGQGPAGTALREERLAVVDDVPSAFDEEQYRDIALEYDVRAIAAIPLLYDDSSYGVFVLLSDRTGTFNASERELLEELGGDIAHAIDAVETRGELQEERDRRAALFENAPNPIAEVRYDGESPLVKAVNAAFEETFGLTADDVIGRAIDDLIVPPEERDGHEAILEKFGAGEPVETEVTRRTTDGLRDFLLTVSPSDAGALPGGYVWYIDVTERNELRTEIQEKANLLDHIFGQIPTALYVKDRQGRHVRLSDYDMDPNAALGKTDPEIYGDTEFTRQTYADDMRVIETGEPIINKEEYNPENDQWMLTSKVPWYDDEGAIQGLIGVSRLITEKKEYERELERANERLENFASVVSHDLRNPLDVALGNLDVVREDVDDDRLDRVDRVLHRMDTIIDDILTLAKQGGAVVETTSVALSALAERAWANVDTASGTRRVDSDCRFEADETRVLGILENLVANAVHHGGEDVTVTVGALDDGFYVADDGPGIPEAERGDVFDPGYTTSETGTGFGLAIVEDVVDAHGWDVAVTESDAGGARFEITGVDRRE